MTYPSPIGRFSVCTAFAEALREHGIPIDEKLIYNGDYLELSGTLAVRYMLDIRKKQPEVIVA
jgi:DNA-binding LacI/PurR family transcriptional regulator